MEEHEELIQRNRVYIENIKILNLSDEGIIKMKEDADQFLVKILSKKDLYEKLREEVYYYLKNLDTNTKEEGFKY